jgi:tetratricopeptide (TPR) repeat protein
MGKSKPTVLQNNTHKKSNLIFYLVFILIAFVFYGNSIKNGYAIDDELVTSTDVKANKIVDKGIGGIVEIFQSRYANDGKQTYDYRPITTLSFAIEHSIVGKSEHTAQISHFVSVSLYAICGILLFLFLLQLLGVEAKWFAFLVVVLYLIHPVHTEIVDNIKTRDELLAVSFGLLAAIHAFKYYDRKKLKYVLFAVLFLALALLSRPSGKVFIGLIPLSLYFFRTISLKKLGLFFLGIIVCYFCVGIFSKLSLQVPNVRIHDFFENPLYKMGFAPRIPMFFYTILRYILLLFFPYPLKYFYGYNDFPLIAYNNWELYVGILVVGWLLFVAFKGIKQKTPLSYAILFFFFGIGGVANLLMPAAGIFAERFANLASIGFVLTLVVLLFQWQKWDIRAPIPSQKRTFTFGFTALIALPCLLYVINRNQDWRSKITLYKADIQKLQHSTKAHSLLATEYMFLAMDKIKSSNLVDKEMAYTYADSADFYFRNSLDIYPNYTSSWNNIAVVQFNFRDDYDSAIVLARKAVAVDSNYQEGYFNLGNCYAKTAVLYKWLYTIYADSTTKVDTYPNVMLWQVNKDLVNTKFKRTLVIIKNLEGMIKSLTNPKLSNNQIVGFVSYVQKIEQLEGQYLPKLNLSGHLQKTLQLNALSRSEFVENLLRSLYTYIAEQLRIVSKNKLYSKEIQLSYFNSNVLNYSDSAFSAFDKLYRVDPGFKSNFNAAFDFANAFNTTDKMVEWGKRYISSFPNENNGMAYMQVAYAYFKSHNRDSSIAYYQKTIVTYQKEQRRLRDLPDRSEEQEKELGQISGQIQSVQKFIKESGSLPDSLFFK